MKKLTYILLTLCLTLYSCGMTDVWKEWENEGNMGPDRLKPSEVKKALCAAEGWKFNYQGHICYFQFDENGTVVTNTDKSILEDKVESDYYLDFDGEKVVVLTMSGALKYLPGNPEEVFAITQTSGQEIVMTERTSAREVNLTSVTTAELKANENDKADALILKKQLEELAKNGTGVFRNDEERFVVHYAISRNENGSGSIRLSRLNQRILEHQDIALTWAIDNELVTFTLGEPATIDGSSLRHLYYNFTTHAMTSDCALTLDSNKDIVKYYTGSSWKKHKITNYYSHGDAKEELWQELAWKGVGDIELDDRAERNFVLCPGPQEELIWYILYPTNWTVGDDADRIYFNSGQPTQPYGTHDSEDINRANANLSKFFAAFYDEDGFYMIQDRVLGKVHGEDKMISYVYFLSPTNDNWFMVDDKP